MNIIAAGEDAWSDGQWQTGAADDDGWLKMMLLLQPLDSCGLLEHHLDLSHWLLDSDFTVLRGLFISRIRFTTIGGYVFLNFFSKVPTGYDTAAFVDEHSLFYLKHF